MLSKNRQRMPERNALLVRYYCEHPSEYYSDIGHMFGIHTKQRVCQILKEARACPTCYHAIQPDHDGIFCSCRELSDMVHYRCPDWHPREVATNEDD